MAGDIVDRIIYAENFSQDYPFSMMAATNQVYGCVRRDAGGAFVCGFTLAPTREEALMLGARVDREVPAYSARFPVEGVCSFVLVASSRVERP